MLSPLWSSHLSYKVIFSMSQRHPLNTGLTVCVLYYWLVPQGMVKTHWATPLNTSWISTLSMHVWITLQTCFFYWIVVSDLITWFVLKFMSTWDYSMINDGKILTTNSESLKRKSLRIQQIYQSSLRWKVGWLDQVISVECCVFKMGF